MKIYPPPLVIGDKEGFTPENDIFKQAELGEGMTNLVSEISDPLVIAFNGKWGTGKTTFLKMWAGELRKLDFPVIYFDAFENDYVDDAFAVLAREIIELAEDAKPKDKEVVKNFQEQATKFGVILLKGAAKVGTKAAVRAATAGLVKEGDIREAIQEIADEASTEYMKDFFTKPKEQKNIVSEFKKTLENLPSLISPPKKDDKQRPMVFIIDELDRCKPLFALQILERIKHFMSVPNVHFIFGVHLKQLEQSVKFAYGADIDDATTYLQKFINVTISNADTAEHDHNKHIIKYISHLKASLNLKSSNEINSLIKFLQQVALKNQYSLRVLERIFTNIMLAQAFAKETEPRWNPLISGLCILKVVEPKLFLKAKAGKLKYDDVKKIFGFSNLSPDGENYKRDGDRDWWELVLSEPLPDRLEEFKNNAMPPQYNFEKRKDMLTFTANKIVDRLNPV